MSHDSHKELPADIIRLRLKRSHSPYFVTNPRIDIPHTVASVRDAEAEKEPSHVVYPDLPSLG